MRETGEELGYAEELELGRPRQSAVVLEVLHVSGRIQVDGKIDVEEIPVALSGRSHDELDPPVE